MNKAKVEPKIVQGILRDSEIQTTLDLYTQEEGDETSAAQRSISGRWERLPRWSVDTAWLSGGAAVVGFGNPLVFNYSGNRIAEIPLVGAALASPAPASDERRLLIADLNCSLPWVDTECGRSSIAGPVIGSTTQLAVTRTQRPQTGHCLMARDARSLGM